MDMNTYDKHTWIALGRGPAVIFQKKHFSTRHARMFIYANTFIWFIALCAMRLLAVEQYFR